MPGRREWGTEREGSEGLGERTRGRGRLWERPGRRRLLKLSAQPLTHAGDPPAQPPGDEAAAWAGRVRGGQREVARRIVSPAAFWRRLGLRLSSAAASMPAAPSHSLPLPGKGASEHSQRRAGASPPHGVGVHGVLLVVCVGLRRRKTLHRALDGGGLAALLLDGAAHAGCR